MTTLAARLAPNTPVNGNFGTVTSDGARVYAFQLTAGGTAGASDYLIGSFTADGTLTWTLKAGPWTTPVQAAACGGGMLVAVTFVAGGPVAYVSRDGGQTWGAANYTSTTFTIYGLTWDGTQFVGAGGNYHVASTDGVNWSRYGATASFTTGRAIAFNGTRYYTQGYGTQTGAGAALAAQTWPQQNVVVPYGGFVHAIAAQAGMFVLAANRAVVYGDGLGAWVSQDLTTVDAFSPGQFQNIGSAGDLLIICPWDNTAGSTGSNFALLCPAPGAAWVSTPLLATGQWMGGAWISTFKSYVAVAANGSTALLQGALAPPKFWTGLAGCTEA